MVKRCGKSAPPVEQLAGHGKPHRVQGQIGNPGAARSTLRESATGSGYRSLRQMILSAPQGAQTELGLQPFQNHFAGQFLRSTTAAGPALPKRSIGVNAITSGRSVPRILVAVTPSMNSVRQVPPERVCNT